MQLNKLTEASGYLRRSNTLAKLKDRASATLLESVLDIRIKKGTTVLKQSDSSVSDEKGKQKAILESVAMSHQF